MKDHVRILLMGDDGVGKSSLLSAYISRHFPQEVPSVLSDTMLPPEATANHTCVTIMDSSARISDRELLKQKILLADSIVLVYDVTRPETLDSIITNWIPLIHDIQKADKSRSAGGGGIGQSRLTVSATGSAVGQSTLSQSQSLSYPSSSRSKPLIILGTKLDLLAQDEETFFGNARYQHLFEHSPDLMFYVRCSALRLQYVDDLFHIAESIVTYPVKVIFDLQAKEFTPLASRAFQRIFRIADQDGDNLISDVEMCNLQLNCFDLGIDHSDLQIMKKRIENRIVDGIYTSCFTFVGFLELLKMAIERSEFALPWIFLRYYHYDDDLNLQMPPEMLRLPRVKRGQIFELSEPATNFLLNLARNAYSDNTRPIKSADSDSTSEIEECLTDEALKWIMSVLPETASNPWVNPPNFQSPWAFQEANASPTIEQSILLTAFPHEGAILSFDDWLTQWNILAVNDPLLVQRLLFQLGYCDRNDNGLVLSDGTVSQLFQKLASRNSSFFPALSPSSTSLTTRYGGRNRKQNGHFIEEGVIRPRSTIKICILGDNDVGKSSLVWSLSKLRLPGFRYFSEDLETSADYQKPEENIVIGGSILPIVREQDHQHHRDGTSRERGTSDLSENNSPIKITETHPASAAINTKTYKVDYLSSYVYISIAAIPYEHMGLWSTYCLDSYDLVLLMFNCVDKESLDTALEIEKDLPEDLPRLFICSKVDLLSTSSAATNLMTSSSSEVHTPVANTTRLHHVYEEINEQIHIYVQEEALLPCVNLSTVTGDGILDVIDQLKTVLTNPYQAIPRRFKNRKWYNQLGDTFTNVYRYFFHTEELFDYYPPESYIYTNVFGKGNIYGNLPSLPYSDMNTSKVLNTPTMSANGGGGSAKKGGRTPSSKTNSNDRLDLLLADNGVAGDIDSFTTPSMMSAISPFASPNKPAATRKKHTGGHRSDRDNRQSSQSGTKVIVFVSISTLTLVSASFLFVTYNDTARKYYTDFLELSRNWLKETRQSIGNVFDRFGGPTGSGNSNGRSFWSFNNWDRNFITWSK